MAHRGRRLARLSPEIAYAQRWVPSATTPGLPGLRTASLRLRGPVDGVNESHVIALRRRLNGWERNNEVAAVVLHAHRAETAVHGVSKRIAYLAGAGEADRARELHASACNLADELLHAEVPVVAVFDGHTHGGALAAGFGGFRVATERSAFALPDLASEGVLAYANGGLAWALPRMVGSDAPLALLLALSSARLGGRDAVGYVLSRASAAPASFFFFMMIHEHSWGSDGVRGHRRCNGCADTSAPRKFAYA
jgi:enoyl-CoA hydratase/carnithine racemase